MIPLTGMVKFSEQLQMIWGNSKVLLSVTLKEEYLIDSQPSGDVRFLG
jgi:hypothetical protein